ncbi:hypothetical protein O6H91_12G077900 [Diphasiastrum complanatum]|uniref:Uncharacterized protein n=2 Tax=Diphasiastrum complanatum TaxID=34168 RepID=A0ACC2C493_DIPCM|nr:hypothetical protein O6H91_12G077900 [Diphasiastrum complanatum]KAJ7536693.1 hypothetical protein O6H91_12G077900 [Diphasiastrum complanatum]
MKLFSWIHGMHKKGNHVDSKTSTAALHYDCKSYTNKNLETEEEAPKTLPQRGQIDELEICLARDCLGVEDPFEDEFEMYRERIRVVFSHEQFGLLAIGTFGFDALRGEPEIKSLQLKQIGEQSNNLHLINDVEQLEGTLDDVFGAGKQEDPAGTLMRCISSAAHEDGLENTIIVKSSKPLAKEDSVTSYETPSSKKGKFAKVIGWHGGNKVHPSVNADSNTPYEAVEASHTKKKFRDKFLKQCKVLGSCFGSDDVDLTKNKDTIQREYCLQKKKSLSSRLKTLLSSDNSSAALCTQDVIQQAQPHGHFQTPKISCSKSGGRVLASGRSKEPNLARVIVAGGPDKRTALTEDLQQQHSSTLRNYLPPRQRGLQKPESSHENWIKTDSEYVVLECI